MRTPLLAALTMAACACGNGSGGNSADATAALAADAAPIDANSTASDGRSVDATPASSDAAASTDAAPLDAPLPDATAPDAMAPDAGHTSEHVHIYIDNFCNVSTSPTEITVPSGGSVNIDWHNHSVDYAADVWMSYGGGYLELATGATWNEAFEWCAGVAVYTGSADIGPAGVSSSVCPHVQFPIHCL